nr:MAG: hypothetical protein [Fish-associated picorna-like virus 4]
MNNLNKNKTQIPTEKSSIVEQKTMTEQSNGNGQKTNFKNMELQSNGKTIKTTELTKDGQNANGNGQNNSKNMNISPEQKSCNTTVLTYEELAKVANGQMKLEDVTPKDTPKIKWCAISKIRSYETEFGYIEVYQDFPGYESWKYRSSNRVAKELYDELCKGIIGNPHKEISNVLRLMRMSTGQNDFTIPMSMYSYIMELKGKETLQSEASFTRFLKRVNGLAGNKTRSTIWSQHDDYDIYKRIAFRLEGTKMPKIKSFDEFLSICENRSLIKNTGNFKFIDRNNLVFRFNGINYHANQITTEVIGEIANSVHNQKMDIKQILETASVIATLKVVNYSPVYVYYEDNIVNYLNVVIDMLRQLTIRADVTTIVTELLKIVSIIPVKSVEKLTDYIPFGFNEIKSLFKSRDLVIETREEAELAEKNEGILVGGTKVKYFNGSSEKINILTVTSNVTDEHKVVRAIVNELEKTGLFRQSVLIGYELSKTFKIKVINYSEQHGRTLPSHKKAETEVRSDLIYIHLTDILARKSVVNDSHPGLLNFRINILNKLRQDLEVLRDILKMTPQQILQEMINKYPEILYLLKLREKYARSISYFLNMPVKNTFSNTTELKTLLEEIVTELEVRVETTPETTRQEVQCVDDDYIEHGVLDVIKAPFKMTMHNYRRVKGAACTVYDTVTDVGKLTGTAEEAMLAVKRSAEKLAERLDQTGMNNTSTKIAAMDMTTFKSAFESTKGLMRAIFNDIIDKIGSLLGIEMKSDVDAYQLFVYYLLWKNTTSTSVKTLIILDIMSSFGIIDKAWEILTWIFNKTVAIGKSIFTYTDNVSEEILEFEKSVETKIARENVPTKIEEPKASEETEESFFKDLIGSLERGTPAFLALLGTGALISFGIYKENQKSSVDRFNRSLKSIGLIGLALGSVPKIYQNIMKVVYYVFDEVKGFVSEKHVSETALIKRMGRFLQTAVYVPGVSEVVFMNDISYCFKFMSHFAEYQELNKQLYKIKDVALRTTFVTRGNAMEKLLGTVDAAIQILLPKHELFHVQITSEPGMGKTDLSKRVMVELYKEREECIAKAMKEANIEYKGKESDFTYYPSNDGLKFMDNYRGQEIMYADEVNISSEVENDKILMELMMASGAPVITNQANLTDKGRLLDVAIKVTNTNNPFIRPTGLLKPEALWRRRELFKLELKKEYQNSDGTLNTNHANVEVMSKSKHILINWMNALKPNTKHERDPKPQGMEVDDFVYLIRVLYRAHFAREMNRANYKTPNGNYLKLLHMSNMYHLYNTMRSEIDLKKYKLDNQSINTTSLNLSNETREHLDRIAELSETEQREEMSSMDLGRIAKELQLKINELSKIMQEGSTICTAEEECNSPLCVICNRAGALRKLEAMKLAAKLTKDVLSQDATEVAAVMEAVKKLEEYQEHGFLSFSDTWSNFTLKKITKNDETFYMLQPVREPQRMREGTIDWTRIEIKTVDGEERIIYTGHVTEENTSSVLYHLANLSTYTKGAVESRLKIELSKLQIDDKSTHYMAHFRIMLEDGFRAVTSALKSIFQCVYDIISIGFLRGVIMTIAIFVMFVTLGGIGRILVGDGNYEEHGRYKAQGKAAKKDVVNYFPHGECEDTEEADLRYDDIHMYKSTIKIKIMTDGKMMTGTGTAIAGYLYLISRHVAAYLPGVDVRVCDAHKVEIDPEKAWRKVNIGKIVEIPNADAVLVEIKDCRMLRASLKHFVTEDDLEYAEEEFGNTQVRVLMCHKEACKGMPEGYHKHSTEKMDITSGYSTKHHRIYHFKNYVEHVQPTLGDSGSIVVHDNSCIQHKILGIYCGKSKVDPLMGVCGVITQEQLRTAMEKFEDKAKIVTFPYEGDYIEHHELVDVLKYDDVLMKSPVVNQSVSRAPGFIKTGCFTDYVDSEPAIQSSNDVRCDPTKRHFMEVSLNKDNGDMIPYITLSEEMDMIGFIKEIIKENWNWQTVSLYTTEQAVNGVKKVGCRPIDIHSSAGLPYKLRSGVEGKQPFIRWSEEQQKYIIKQEILDDVNYKESLFKCGIVSKDLKMEFRKHEIVGLNKIYEKPKTRTVGMGNMVDQIIYDKCFKDMHTGMKSVYRNGKASALVMGLDLEVHANQLVEYLKYTDFILDYDVVAWEEKFTRQICRLVIQAKYQVLAEAYASRGKTLPENLELMLLTLVDDSIYSNVVYEDTVRTRMSGLLSGWPGTLPDNSLAHVGLIFLVIQRILKGKHEKRKANSTYIKQHARMICAADDVGLALSPELRELVTPEDIQKGYLELGYELTAPDKTPKIKARTIYEIEFLKHNFVFRDGKFESKIMNKVIYQLLAFVRTSTKLTVNEQMKVNIIDAMRFAYWHGQEFYEELRQKVNTEFAKHSIAWNTNYGDMDIVVKHLMELEQKSDNAPIE